MCFAVDLFSFFSSVFLFISCVCCVALRIDSSSCAVLRSHKQLVAHSLSYEITYMQDLSITTNLHYMHTFRLNGRRIVRTHTLRTKCEHIFPLECNKKNKKKHQQNKRKTMEAVAMKGKIF